MDTVSLGIASVAAISVICYLLCQGIKTFGLNKKWCPVFCGLLGGIIGVISYYTVADFPAQDVITAIALGIESGLMATGMHHISKQLGE